jgi:hypothetical protein
MDSIRNPFFASAVATVDRVLAAQVNSIFSTQILNNLKPSDIGAVAGVNPQGQLQVFVSSTTDLNLLGAVGTKVDLFTVPAGYRFFSDQFAITFTSVTQSGVMSGVTQPAVRVIKNNSNAAANQISNEIDLSDAGQVVQLLNKYWRTGGAVGGTTSTTGKATATEGEVLSAYITTAISAAGTNKYTVLTAKCFLAGWLIPV